MLGLLADEGALELDYILVNIDDRLRSQTLDLQDRWVGIVLDQADNFVLVKLGLLRESEYL